MKQLEFDPEIGLWIMTKEYLLSRGSCCGSGCRNCPYDKEEFAIASRKNADVNCLTPETPQRNSPRDQ
jgi:hypothetical protein